MGDGDEILLQPVLDQDLGLGKIRGRDVHAPVMLNAAGSRGIGDIRHRRVRTCVLIQDTILSAFRIIADLDLPVKAMTWCVRGSDFAGTFFGASSSNRPVFPPAALKLLTKILRGLPSVLVNGVKMEGDVDVPVR